MASDFEISVQAQNDACDAIVDLVDAGSGAGYFEIRTGAPPASCAAANSGTLLATLTCSDPAFGSASAGTATANPINDDSSADASGDAGHFRLFNSNNTCVMQGTCGESADSPDLTFDDKSIVSGGVVAIDSFTVTVPLQ